MIRHWFHMYTLDHQTASHPSFIRIFRRCSESVAGSFAQVDEDARSKKGVGENHACDGSSDCDESFWEKIHALWSRASSQQ